MKEFKELKEGDKLYSLSYYNKSMFGTDMKRELQTVTVKKRVGNYIKLKYGYQWTVSNMKYGSEWFDNKIDCYKKAKELHTHQLENIQEAHDRNTKEIKYLEGRIKSLTKKEEKQKVK